MSSTICAKPKAKAQPSSITAEEQMRLDYYLYAALNASEHKSHAQAYFLLELCYQIDPTNPTVNSLLGSYQLSLYGKERALPLLRQAYEGSPDDYWYHYTITAYESGSRTTAMNVLKVMEKRDPKNIDILELHEHILLHERKYKLALAIRDKIDKLTGEPTVQSVVTRYETYRSMGDRKKALRVLDSYLKRNPNDGRMRAMRTDIDLNAAQQNNDIQIGRQLLTLQLQSADVSLQNKIKLLKQHSTWLGYDADTQKAWLQDLREQYPYEQDIYQALMDYEESQGDIRAAIEIGRTMLTMNPTNNNVRNRIETLMRSDPTISPDDLGHFAEESYAALPDDPKWSYYKAILVGSREQYDSAVVILENALIHAEEPVLRLQILSAYALLLSEQKNNEKAYAAFEEALKLSPDNLSILNNYAWTLAINGGDLKKAEKMSQRTIQKEANNPTYLDTYAWILHLQGQDSLAMFYIKKALEQADNNGDETIDQHFNEIYKALNKDQ
ncbi:MAG: tetratricopeptide repeat protein [Paludibacteraceae bacterium]|nr:tetratricopeptide repeat protein [Paludibacteraceae bacterium]